MSYSRKSGVLIMVFEIKKPPIELKVLLHRSVDSFAREAIIRSIELSFNIDFDISTLRLNIEDACNHYRGQYDAEKILNAALILIPNKLFLIAIGYDIYVPNLNFVFGVALPNHGCIISTWRLRDRDREVYEMRILKTVRHELGHVFGLTHCNRYCVMRFANSLLELDMKSKDFCDKCKSRLARIGIVATS